MLCSCTQTSAIYIRGVHTFLLVCKIGIPACAVAPFLLGLSPALAQRARTGKVNSTSSFSCDGSMAFLGIDDLSHAKRSFLEIVGILQSRTPSSLPSASGSQTVAFAVTNFHRFRVVREAHLGRAWAT